MSDKAKPSEYPGQGMYEQLFARVAGSEGVQAILRRLKGESADVQKRVKENPEIKKIIEKNVEEENARNLLNAAGSLNRVALSTRLIPPEVQLTSKNKSPYSGAEIRESINVTQRKTSELLKKLKNVLDEKGDLKALKESEMPEEFFDSLPTIPLGADNLRSFAINETNRVMGALMDIYEPGKTPAQYQEALKTLINSGHEYYVEDMSHSPQHLFDILVTVIDTANGYPSLARSILAKAPEPMRRNWQAIIESRPANSRFFSVGDYFSDKTPAQIEIILGALPDSLLPGDQALRQVVELDHEKFKHLMQTLPSIEPGRFALEAQKALMSVPNNEVIINRLQKVNAALWEVSMTKVDSKDQKPFSREDFIRIGKAWQVLAENNYHVYRADRKKWTSPQSVVDALIVLENKHQSGGKITGQDVEVLPRIGDLRGIVEQHYKVGE